MIGAVNLAEVLARLVDKEVPEEVAWSAVTGLGLRTVELDPELARATARLRAVTRRHGLSFGDRATNLRRDLLVELEKLLPPHLDLEHGASNNSFIMSAAAYPSRGLLQAVIEEARKHARRRRVRYGFLLLIVAAAGVSARRADSHPR